jgi:Bacterial Ig domain/Putative Ig domain
MKVLRILLGAVTAAGLATASLTAEPKRPPLITRMQHPGERPVLTTDGPVKAIHLAPGGGPSAVTVMAKGGPARAATAKAAAASSTPQIEVFGTDQVFDGDTLSYSLSVTAGDLDLAPFTVDLEYSEGLNAAIDPQGFQCTFGAPGHASCDWTTTLPAGETTGTATFAADAQAPYGGIAECDPGRSPCAFLRATLAGVASGFASTAIVENGNTPPVAVADAIVLVATPSPITVDVLANDSDQDGDPLTVSIAVPPTQGTTDVDPATNHIVYTPDPSFSGSDSFRYRITDPSGAAASALVTVHQVLGSISFQLPVNDIGNIEPGHVAFRWNYLENTTGLDIIGGFRLEPVDPAEFPALLAGTPYDPARAVSDVSVFSGPGGARFEGFSVVSEHAVSCRPNAPTGRVSLARVHFTLSPEMYPSVVFEPSYVVVARSGEGSEVPVHVLDDVVTTPVDTPILIHPLVNDDSVAGLPLSVSGLAAAEPFHFAPPFIEGSVQFADPQAGIPFTGALYTPPAAFEGTTAFYYAASETHSGMLSDRYDYAKITVNVSAGSNHAPVAHSLTGSVPHEGSRVFLLSALATDADGDPLTVQIVAPPAHGTATVQVDQSVLYVPSPHFVGADSFQFTASDGSVPSNVGTVSIAVTDAAPVLGILTNLTVPELSPAGFTASAADPEGDPLTFSLVGAPAGAQIGSGTGIFSWIPTEAQGPGSFTFRVRVTETASPALFDERPITITVTEVNAAPTLTLPALPAHLGAGTPFGFSATASDPDLPANTLAFSLSGAPAGASMGSANGVFSWTPSAAQAGITYTFAVVVTDDGTPARAAQQSVTITVDAAAPTATLLVSAAPDRSNPQSLGGRTLSRLVYIFVGPSAAVTRARFWLDDPTRTGPPRQVENLPPFDFAGTAANGSAQALDTRRLPNGPHVVSAEVTLSGGQIVQLQATFTVANADPALQVSVSSNRSNPRPLAARTVWDVVYVFLEPNPYATRVRFWLDASPSQPPHHTELAAPFDFEGTAPNGNAMPFDTRSIAPGLHVMWATVDYLGLGSVTVSAPFLVTR